MKVKIKDFQSIREADLEIKPFTVVVGPSDSGKSAIIRSLAALFYNTPGDYYVSYGAKSCEVKLELPHNTIEFKKGSSSKYTIDDEEYTAIGRGYFENLAPTGIREIDADGKKVRPQVAMQIDTPFLLSSEYNPMTVASLLGNLSNAAVLNTAKREVEKDIKKIGSKIKHLESDLVERKKELADEGELQALLSRVEKIKKKDAEILEITGVLSEVSNYKDIIGKNKTDIKDLEQTLKHITELRKELTIQESAQKVINVSALMKKIEDMLEYLRKIFADVKAKLTLVEKKRFELREVQSVVSSMESIQMSIKKTQIDKDYYQKSLEKIEKKLKDIPTCPTCGRPK